MFLALAWCQFTLRRQVRIILYLSTFFAWSCRNRSIRHCGKKMPLSGAGERGGYSQRYEWIHLSWVSLAFARVTSHHSSNSPLNWQFDSAYNVFMSRRNRASSGRLWRHKKRLSHESDIGHKRHFFTRHPSKVNNNTLTLALLWYITITNFFITLLY